MGYLRVDPTAETFWAVVARQHGVIAHRQLVGLGLHSQAVKRRAASGRLHRLWPRRIRFTGTARST